MTKKYLIDENKTYHEDINARAFEISDAKEVEVLDDSVVGNIIIDYAYSGHLTMESYFKANNLQIIKIKE